MILIVPQKFFWVIFYCQNIVKITSTELKERNNWCTANKLSLNESQTKLILFRLLRQHHHAFSSIKLNNSTRQICDISGYWDWWNNFMEKKPENSFKKLENNCYIIWIKILYSTLNVIIFVLCIISFIYCYGPFSCITHKLHAKKKLLHLTTFSYEFAHYVIFIQLAKNFKTR